MRESDLYPIIVAHLQSEKHCYPEYTGTEFFFGKSRGIRTDVFGVSQNQNNDIILYFCEGKLHLDMGASFTASQFFSLPDYGDFLYFFGKGEQSDDVHPKIFGFCKDRGIGIFLVDETNKVHEILPAARHTLDKNVKKELIYRAFFRTSQKPIADLIFQCLFEFALMHPPAKETGIPFIQLYEEIFQDGIVKPIINEITGSHTLEPIDIRKAFQTYYKNSELIDIQKAKTRLDDVLYITKKGMMTGKTPILLKPIR